MMAYELPLVVAACVPILGAEQPASRGHRRCRPQRRPRPPDMLALAVAALCMQAMLGQVPFDLPEAEAELTGGALIEYSGPPLAFYRLTRAMMLFLVPCFLIALFLVPASAGDRSLAARGGCSSYTALLVDRRSWFETPPRASASTRRCGSSGDRTTAVAIGAVALGARGLVTGAPVSIRESHPVPIALRLPHGGQRLQQLRHRDPRCADAEVRSRALRHRPGRQHPPRRRDPGVGRLQPEGRRAGASDSTSRRPSPSW